MSQQTPSTPGSREFVPDDWNRYFDAEKGLPPRETLVCALDLFDGEFAAAGRAIGPIDRPMAIDLGAGDGRDTVEMLRRGWRVIAIDSSASGIARLMDRVDIHHMDRVEARVQRFEDAPLVPADLINASFSIPHCDPAVFGSLWTRLTASIKPGGRFAGQLFGVHDQWATSPDGITRTYHTIEQVRGLLSESGLVAERLDEIQRDGQNAFGEPKRWHVFHIVAKRIGR